MVLLDIHINKIENYKLYKITEAGFFEQTNFSPIERLTTQAGHSFDFTALAKSDKYNQEVIKCFLQKLAPR